MKQNNINPKQLQQSEMDTLIKKVKRNVLYLGRNQWLTIFSYLNMYELAKCELVCQNWNSFIKSENIQLGNIFSYFEYKVDDFRTLKQQKTLIQKLRWFNFHIKFYNLYQFQYENQVYEELQKVNVYKKIFTQIEELFQTISQMSNLKTLQLSISQDFQKCSNLKVILQKIVNLEAIHLAVYQSAENSLDLVIDLLRQSFATLKCLQISQLISKQFFLNLLRNINENCIKVLVFCFDDINEDIIKRLIQFTKLKYMVTYSRRQVQIKQNKHALKLIEKIGYQLICLKIDNLTDNLIIQIANYCPNVIVIQTESQFLLQDESIYYLLQKCTKLKYLIVNGCNNLTVKCIPLNLNCLRQLKVKDTKFTIEDKHYLESKLTQLKVVL